MIFPDAFEANADASTGFALFRVYELWSASAKRALRGVGITHPQFTVMTVVSYLSRSGETVSQAETASMSGIDPMTVSGIVRNLEKRGLVTRERSSVDSRAWDVQLTSAGQFKLDEAFPLVEAANTEFFSTLPDEALFRAHLHTLRQARAERAQT